MNGPTPILYSFRRCPYAMRARLALFSSRQSCVLREVVLRDKPAAMIKVSPKATVPVLVLTDGCVIDESLDIMIWALGQNDPGNWMLNDTEKLTGAMQLIEENDGPFKIHLDRYKYGNRHEKGDPLAHREQGLAFLAKLNDHLSDGKYLLGDMVSLADFAIFPFIRQFANTDRPWFDALNLPFVHKWLADHLESELFLGIMKKYPMWKEGDEEVQFVV